MASVKMTDLQTIPCHIAGVVLGIVLLEDKSVMFEHSLSHLFLNVLYSNNLIDRQDMLVKDIIHMPVSVPWNACMRSKQRP